MAAPARFVAPPVSSRVAETPEDALDGALAALRRSRALEPATTTTVVVRSSGGSGATSSGGSSLTALDARYLNYFAADGTTVDPLGDISAGGAAAVNRALINLNVYSKGEVVASAGGIFTGDVEMPTLKLKGSASGTTDLTANSDGTALLVNGVAVGGGFSTSSNYTVTGNWTFAGAVTVNNALTLGTQATTTAHAVRADRSVATGAAVLGFALSGGGNLTADRTLTVTPPQDLQTTGAPQFLRVGLGLAPGNAHSLETLGSARFGADAFFVGDALPDAHWSSDLGTQPKQWRTLFVGEIRAAVLVASEELATVNEVFYTGAGNALAEPMTTGSTTVTLRYPNYLSGYYVILKGLQSNGSPKTEVIKLTSARTNVTLANGDTGYRHTCTRAQVFSAHAWDEGQGTFSTYGTAGRGWLEQYATQSYVVEAMTAGPTLVAWRRTGTSALNVTPASAVGNLRGLYGVGSDTYGLAAGSETGQNVIATDTKVALRYGTTDMVTLGFDGVNPTARVGTTAGPHVLATDTSLTVQYSSTDYVRLTSGGLTVYRTSVDRASFGTSVRVGRSTSFHALISDTALTLNNDTTTLASFGATTTVGATAGDHVRISTLGLEVKYFNTVRASFGSTAVIGQTGLNKNNVEIKDAAINFRNGTTVVGSVSASVFNIGGFSYNATTNTTTFSGNVTAATLTINGTTSLNGDVFFTGGEIAENDYGFGVEHYLRFVGVGTHSRGNLIVGDIPISGANVTTSVLGLQGANWKNKVALDPGSLNPDGYPAVWIKSPDTNGSGQSFGFWLMARYISGQYRLQVDVRQTPTSTRDAFFYLTN